MAVSKERQPARRAVAWLFVAPAVVALTYLAALPWQAERLIAQIDSGALKPTAATVPPLLEGPWRAVARALRQSPRADPAAAEAALRGALKLRPLFAPAWLHLADLTLERGDRNAAAEYAERAQALWPANPALQRAAVDFHLKAGNGEAALQTLARYWRLVPYRWREVLFLASRLQRDPARLYAAIVPVVPSPRADAGYFAGRFQDFARRTRDPAMAIAGWRQAPASFRSDAREAIRYIGFLLSRERIEPAREAWAELTGTNALPGRAHNAGFESPLTGGGFGWRLYDIQGAAAVRDDQVAHAGGHSLKIAFDGAANVNYHHVRQTILVEPGTTYRLQAFLRGENVTTRSGAYLDIRTTNARKNAYAKTAAHYGTWDWQPVATEITVPDDATLAEIRIRRASTDALDNKVAGVLWLDDVTLVAR